MNKQDFKYVELVTNDLNNRGNIIELPSHLTNIDLSYYGKEVLNGFHSVFLYPRDIQEHQRNTGSIRNYNGPVYCEYLYFDMDGETVEDARSEAIELVERLIPYHEVRIFFSGCKGFHILMNCPELEDMCGVNNFNDIVKNVCTTLAEGLKCFDARIYDKTRIIRIPNSKHPASGLYKIPISYEELKTFDENGIKVLAKEQRMMDSLWNSEKNPEITSLLITASEEKVSTKGGGFLSASELLDGISNGFKSGNRNNAFASIAGMLHRRNIGNDFIQAMLLSINSNNGEPLPKSEIETIVNSISRYKIDPQYADKTNDDIVGIEEAGKTWYKLITASGYCSFGDRFTHVNERMKLCIPGDTIAIVANSGVGKTTLGLELGNEEAKIKDQFSLIASLEMSKAGIFFRTATIEASDLAVDNYVPSAEVASSLLGNTTLRDKTYKNWANLKIIDRGGLTLDKIIDYFNIAQDIYEGKICNLVIDYAQNIAGAEDITYSMGMARRFKEIAKDLNTKLFVLMQCNKTMPDDYTEVMKNHIEGAGAYYQAMDYIITAWKSGSQKNRLHAKFLKERWGDSAYRFDLVRDGLKYHSDNFLEDEGGRLGYAL